MGRPTLRQVVLLLSLLLAWVATGCGNDDPGVSSDEEARRAYLGLDTSVEKALNLGMDGFNAASSANIPEQMAAGDVAGTIAINGQVDQGASANKEMRLTMTLVGYTDGPAVTVDGDDIDISYDTDAAALPTLDLSLRGIPSGTFTGTLAGTFHMSGDLTGDATLALTMSGEIEDDTMGGIRRKLGTTHVTGTAVSGNGTYNVDIML